MQRTQNKIIKTKIRGAQVCLKLVNPNPPRFQNVHGSKINQNETNVQDKECVSQRNLKGSKSQKIIKKIITNEIIKLYLCRKLHIMDVRKILIKRRI